MRKYVIFRHQKTNKMAVYKFRVTFEDYEDVSRDIEIKSTQNFADLHNIIQDAVKFDKKHDASFFMSDDYWSKGQEIALQKPIKSNELIPLMKKSRICDFIIDPHQKFYYVFDNELQWAFHVELIKIILEEEKNIKYPRVVRSIFEAPKQYTPIPLEKGQKEEYDFLNEEAFEEETHIGHIGEGIGKTDDQLLSGDDDLDIGFSDDQEEDDSDGMEEMD